MNKEGTFMWAVEQMKQGKKVRRSIYHEGHYLMQEHLDIIIDERKISVCLGIVEFDALDWEVVEDDKDWNLAEQEEADECTGPKTGSHTKCKYWGSDVKKCRDLIIKDLQNGHCTNDCGVMSISYKKIYETINKRFGDLK